MRGCPSFPAAHNSSTLALYLPSAPPHPHSTLFKQDFISLFILPLLTRLTLLFSNKTLSRRRSLFILPSFQTTGEGHQGFTTDSHFGEKHFFPSDAAFSLVWSALLFLSYRRDKSVKDKDKYKDKTVKETQTCFPPVQIVLWDHRLSTISLTHGKTEATYLQMNT